MTEIADIKRTLERKSNEFETNKEISIERITDSFRIAREKLDRTERELLKKLDSFFGPNMYSECIAELDTKNLSSLGKIASFASTPVPTCFCPNEEAFGRLYKEICRLSDMTSAQPVIPPAPKNLTINGVRVNNFYNEASLSWSAVVPNPGSRVDCVKYKVEMTNEHKTTNIYDSTGLSYVFNNLNPETTYMFRVCCSWDNNLGPWCDAVEFTTPQIPVPTNVKCTAVKECEATISWDAIAVNVSWEVEICKKKEGTNFKKEYDGKVSSCTLKCLENDTEYLVRVRAKTNDGKCGKWNDELKFITTKWTCSWMQCPPGVETKKKVYY